MWILIRNAVQEVGEDGRKWVGGKFLKALAQLFKDSTCIGIPRLCLADKLRIVTGGGEVGTRA